MMMMLYLAGIMEIRLLLGQVYVCALKRLMCRGIGIFPPMKTLLAYILMICRLYGITSIDLDWYVSYVNWKIAGLNDK